MNRVLINASNLHVGGGVQVACSLIQELSRIYELPAALPELHVIASSTVNINLGTVASSLNFASYFVHNSFGWKGFFSNRSIPFSEYDAVLTVFGPLYTFSKPRNHVIGFALPLSIYPKSEAFSKIPLLKRIYTRTLSSIQLRLFSRADIIVVEANHVRDAIARNGIAPFSKIKIIRNTVAKIYHDPVSWMPVDIPKFRADISLCFIGRNYPHKNINIFTEVHRILKKLYGIDAKLIVTFTSNEWSECTSEFHDCAVNVGPLLVNQCPSLYKAVNGVFFPSLLECFSAVTLESLIMAKPLFASDMPFNREVCSRFAFYFDPLNADEAAASIAKYFLSKESFSDVLESGRLYATSFSSPENRAKEYLQIILDILGQGNV